jgi:hypothetical protein
MAEEYKRAGVQGSAAVGTYVTLYEVPAGRSAVISTIAVVNTASTNATYRIGFDTTAGTPDATEWLIYDAIAPLQDTIFLTIGVAIPAGTFIRVSSSANTVTFQAFISEIV